MNVLVFGGSGFLGGYVADELSSQGHNVTIFDKKKYKYIKNNKKMIIIWCVEYQFQNQY